MYREFFYRYILKSNKTLKNNISFDYILVESICFKEIFRKKIYNRTNYDNSYPIKKKIENIAFYQW